MANITRRETNPNTNPRTASIWDPFRIMESMLGWNPATGLVPETGAMSPQGYVPRFDVKETKDSYVFTADLPGIKESDLDISLTGNQLVVSGKRECKEEKDTEQYHLYECSYGRFSRTFSLPEGINPDQVTAHLNAGVLTLTVGKKPEVQPRRIALSGKSAATA